MKKVAFLGGSFDPPHIGHVINIMEVIKSGLVDEVWVMPVGDHMEKNLIASRSQRMVMTEMMISSFFGTKYPIFLKTEDLDSEVPLSSYRLFGLLRKKYPDIELFMVIGDDIVPNIFTWDEGKELLQTGKFIVVPRLGDPQKKITKEIFTYLDRDDFVQTNASSTAIRNRIGRGEIVEAIVPPVVIAYIIRQGLYRKE